MGRNKTVGECSAGEGKYRANPEFILREVAGETLLVPTGKTAHRLNAAIVMSESGAVLWKRLVQASQTVKELADALVEEYEISPDEASEDVSSFLEKAVEDGIILQESE